MESGQASSSSAAANAARPEPRGTHHHRPHSRADRRGRGERHRARPLLAGSLPVGIDRLCADAPRILLIFSLTASRNSSPTELQQPSLAGPLATEPRPVREVPANSLDASSICAAAIQAARTARRDRGSAFCATSTGSCRRRSRRRRWPIGRKRSRSFCRNYSPSPALDSRRQRANVALMPTRTIAYLRVSTDKQADRGVSLDAERAKVAAYAELYDLELAEVIVDAGESAKSLDRPGLQRALAMLKAGEAEALLVVKLDRLTRSVVDLGTLVERYFAPGKAALLSVGEQIDTRSAAGRLVLNVLASVSQWEREAVGERTSAALQHKAAQGEYTGGDVPYGYRLAADGERLEAEPAEQVLLAQARRLRRKGLSLRAVARELEAKGFRTRKGRP